MGNTGFCFKALWRPDGRGAIGDLNLIGLIDDNACFEIGAWTLREWSQVTVKIPYNKNVPRQKARPYCSARENGE
jgi:hypothetical protein